jgi:anti-anti-sigma factor
LEITIVESGENLIHVVVSGRLDLSHAGEFEKELKRISARQLPMVIDLSRVDAIASLVIGMLVVCAQGPTRRERRVVLVHPSPLVEKVLRTTKVDQVLPIAADVEQARAMMARA